jgi:hypothetical protein
METMISTFFFENWQRKLIALFSAIVVWVLVNQSITETKILPNVAVRVVNLPSDKTIVGLLPNSYLSNRITLTLSGSKDIIHDLEPSDLEVLLDGSTASAEDWVIQIAKKNLVSLNPELDLRHHITTVRHPEFVIKLSQLITDKVPVHVKRPLGKAPHGYEFLDVWPEQLVQTVSGPKEEVQDLKIKGLKLTLDLGKITKEDLDKLEKEESRDEISFFVPAKWKLLPIPFRHNVSVEINDSEAKEMRIDFLRTQLLPLERYVPISVFYPLKYSDVINPDNHKLSESDNVSIINGIAAYTDPIFVQGVSKLFLDIIRDNISIFIIATPKNEREILQWSVEVIDPHEMEDTFVAYEIAKQQNKLATEEDSRKREKVLRKRFRDYMQKLILYTEKGEKLNLISTLSSGKIVVRNGSS